MGERCQGNINCVPICPVQAKYNAGKTLAKALETGRVDLLARPSPPRSSSTATPAASQGSSTRPTTDPDSAEHTTGTVRGRVFVLAANAVENARLMLASGLPSTQRAGRAQPDGPRLPAHLGADARGRGHDARDAVCTGRHRGPARRRVPPAAGRVRVDIHNDGWGWATGSPYTDLFDLVDDQNQFGARSAHGLVDRISRQLLLAFMVEVLPSQSNRVTVDPRYHGPARQHARRSSRTHFRTTRCAASPTPGSSPARSSSGSAPRTTPPTTRCDHGYVTYEGEGYVIRGGNHWAGTHIMGTDPTTRWSTPTSGPGTTTNLYLVGGGSMPSIGTSNITLTLAALCFRSAEHIAEQLREDSQPRRSRTEAEERMGLTRITTVDDLHSATCTRRCSSSTRRSRRT